ncbi:L-2-hydroxyglutarate dehydrogenase, mitochondrial [Saliniradius amylolyticus]|uniref:L-2-hydroxyglutarate dehydrogenase, mitochondrial n=1 Tax=Saliniradius amylolyticus TaxID=2183582 RepID=A0A2S2E384_9ALTE|nr:L-2-hydroxyglutarate oxidase [Saliniradius amylolyticus]AWL12059.1 L-2-hydroxyglutarate dehydrogenase, mitochondrial [Saliniradius amylolyticus]
MKRSYDLTIIGGGIIGTALAWRLSQRYPRKRVVLLEKESEVALHQTGRNSGVIHAGVYYPPDSLKARYCRQGLKEVIAFCRQQQIPYAQPGKLIVATSEQEVQRLEKLWFRCQDNGLQPQWVDAYELHRMEANISGKAAIRVKDTGIVDYARVARRMLELAQKNGVEVRFSAQVQGLDEGSQGVTVKTNEEVIQTERLVNCAGLMTDRLARMMGLEPDFQIIPFRGEYFRLPKRLNQICRHLIYPVPDPSLPFLGVHLTRMIDGSVTVGPNAVLAAGREAYQWRRFSGTDCMQMATFGGFWRLMGRYWQSGLEEMKNSLWTSGYLQQVRKYCPQIQRRDLQPYPSGIRAQAVNAKGEMLHDFHFLQTERSLHVGNAPSPAATSSIPIADALIQKLVGDGEQHF